MSLKRTISVICFTMIASVMMAQRGIGTTAPDTSSILDITSTNKVFLPTRVAAVNDISNPPKGLMVYDEFNNCIRFYNGTEWSVCVGGAATISTTPCTAGELSSGINGGSLGNKYNNGAGGTYSVVDIGGQCWMAENIDVDPSGSPAWNSFDAGWYGYYNNTWQANDEGTLFQWSALMNNSTTERAQGVCPTGWHVPSDFEFMYLERTLGMTTAQQEATAWRGTDQGTQLKSGGISGYEGLLAGYRDAADENRGTYAIYWSSSVSGGDAYSRSLNSGLPEVGRSISNKALAWSVRCLKD